MNTLITIFGERAEIKSWLFDRYEVEKRAEKFFGCKTFCVPCAFGHNTVSIGWRCSSNTDITLGFVSLETGMFCRIDDYEYPVNMVVPITKVAAQIHGNEVCYTGRELSICPLRNGLS